MPTIQAFDNNKFPALIIHLLHVPFPFPSSSLSHPFPPPFPTPFISYPSSLSFLSSHPFSLPLLTGVRGYNPGKIFEITDARM
jgi:hypothetical protein